MFLSEGCLHRRPECSGESQNTHKNTSLLHAGCSRFIYIYMFSFCFSSVHKTICFLNSSSVSHSTSSKTTTLFSYAFSCLSSHFLPIPVPFLYPCCNSLLFLVPHLSIISCLLLPQVLILNTFFFLSNL